MRISQAINGLYQTSNDKEATGKGREKKLVFLCDNIIITIIIVLTMDIQSSCKDICLKQN